MGWLQNFINWINTDGTPMIGNSVIDVEGKAFGESREETHFNNESIFSNDFSSFNDSFSSGFGSSTNDF